MRKRTVVVLTLLLFLAGLAGAQELVFFDGDVTVAEYVDSGEPFVYRSEDIYFGFQLGPNFVVETGPGSYAEIVLPNGHVLKLAEDTEIVLQNIVARAQSGEDRVSVGRGRLRSVVASLAGTGRSFAVQTPAAVGGVRGTDFVTSVIRDAAGAVTEEAIGVLDGVVDFARSDGQSVLIAAGQFANALAGSFQAQAGDIASRFYGGLQQISERTQQAANEIVQSLPQPAEESIQEGEESEPPAGEEGDQVQEPAVQSGEPETTVTTVQPSVVPSSTPGTEEPEGGESEEGTGGGPVDEFMAQLTNILGLEIGSITLDGQTYGRLIAQPVFQLGKLRAGLYLPVIYSGNLFDPDDWYRPKGNDEWSFGTDQDWRGEPLVAIGDLVGDLALKIKFLEWGAQRDPFFFKVGNLNTLTLGHGLLMRNYANDTDFPAIRRIGFNLGIDPGRLGFEAIVNDLAAPEIFGARVFVRPIQNFRLAIGLSGVADLGPARDLPETSDLGTPIFVDARTADPLFTNIALDLDLPIFEGETAALILYGDVGGLLPYLRQPVGGLDSGFQLDALWHETADGHELRNYGIASGIFGNISAFDYRLEFRNYHGIFEPAFYNANYDRAKGEKAAAVLAYLQNPDGAEYQNETIGVYGEAGLTIAELVRLDAGYLWPWTRDPVTDAIVTGDNDFFLASLVLREGLLPLGISAGFSYERSYFVPTIRELIDQGSLADVSLFDENTVLKGEIIYPVAPIMDLSVSVTTTILRDENGDIQYRELSDGTLKPKWGPVINVQTRLGTDGLF